MSHWKIIIACSVFIFYGCSRENSESQSESNQQAVELKMGGVYATKREEEKYSITKILILEESDFLAISYKEYFEAIPESISTSDLNLMGHVPVTREDFVKAEQHLITTEAITDDQLQGYKWYREAIQNRKDGEQGGAHQPTTR